MVRLLVLVGRLGAREVEEPLPVRQEPRQAMRRARPCRHSRQRRRGATRPPTLSTGRRTARERTRSRRRRSSSLPRPSGASQIVWTGPPPAAGTRFSFRSAKKPMERLSGDQNGHQVASSVPAAAGRRSRPVGRTQMSRLPSAPVAAKASVDPSGESASDALTARDPSAPADRSRARNRRFGRAGAGGAGRPKPSDGEKERRGPGRPREARRAAARRDRRRRSPLCEPPSAIHLSSLLRSAAFCQRSSGSLARQRLHDPLERRRRHRRHRRDRRRLLLHDRRDQRRLARPRKRLLPRRHLVEHAPNAKMSVRASASLPSSCSGAMYWNVPRIVPSCVRFCGLLPITVGSDVTADCTGGAIAFASPKSSSFTPDFVIITLPGFRSRCTIPCRCALSSASAISSRTAASARAAAALREAVARASRPRAAP